MLSDAGCVLCLCVCSTCIILSIEGGGNEEREELRRRAAGQITCTTTYPQRKSAGAADAEST